MLLSRRTWQIAGCHMQLTKWTVDFDPASDVLIVPVWIAFSGFPVHYQQKAALFEIFRIVGTPINSSPLPEDPKFQRRSI